MKKKIAYFIGWILILEILLQLTAFAVQSWNEQSKKSANTSAGTFNILCLGESTTGLGGESSYPKILEKKLAIKSNSNLFKVINAGMPSKDTNDILEQADSLIDKNNPSLGILMVGINDYWNLPDREMKWWERSLEWMSEYSRIAKIIRLTIINLKTESPAPISQDVFISTCNQGPKYSTPEYQSQRKLESLVEKKITNYDIYLNLAEIYRKKNQIQKGIEILNLGVARLNTQGYCPDSYKLQEKVIEYYEKDLKNSQKALEQIEEYLNQRMISYFRFELVNIRKEIRNKLGMPPAEAKVLTYWENMTFKRNLQYLVRKFQARGIPVIVMQYPLMPVAPLKRILLNDSGVIFVENINNFEEVLHKKTYNEVFTDNFAHVFGHMTSLGAQTMAENLVPVILKISGDVKNREDF
nr:GDSL-type esterase/lipase family protein [Bacteriovorax sp. HI3]